MQRSVGAEVPTGDALDARGSRTYIRCAAVWWPRGSGGPTVDENGNVLGVNSFLLRNQQNFNFITDTTDLAVFLRQHGVNPLAARTPSAETSGAPGGAGPLLPSSADSGGFPWWVVGVAVALLLVATGGGFVWYQRSRTKPAPAEQPPAGAYIGAAMPQYGPPPTDEPTCNHQNNPPGVRFCNNCGARLT